MRSDAIPCAPAYRGALRLLVDGGEAGDLRRDEGLAPGLVGFEAAVAVFGLVRDGRGRVSDLHLLGREDALLRNEPAPVERRRGVDVVPTPTVGVAVLAEPAGESELAIVDERGSHRDRGLRPGSGRRRRAKPCVGEGRAAARRRGVVLAAVAVAVVAQRAC